MFGWARHSATFLAVLLVPACGDDGGGRESASGSGAATQGGLTNLTGVSGGSSGGASEGSAGLSASDGSGGSGGAPTSGGGEEGGDEGGGPKFDVAGAPDGGALDCNEMQGGEGYAFSYIWIANTEAGLVSKIATKTGVTEGRYRTSSGGNSPSRTTVNQFGDVLVGNRGETGSVTKIASLESRCVDKNGDGVITTSTGEADVKDWGADECVLWNVPIPSSDYDHGPRALAWEGGELDPLTCMNTVPDPRVWVGFDGANTYKVWRIDGSTGEVVDKLDIPDIGGRPYGGAVNREGDFWMAVRGGPLVFIDSVTLQVEQYTPPGATYGMGVDKDGDPWVVLYQNGPGSDRIFRFDVPSKQFIDAGGTGGYYRGMQIDREDRVWVAGNNPCRLILVDGKTDALVNDAIPLANCKVPVGISIDVDGFVWLVDQGANLAYKIDPVTYQIGMQVPVPSAPYTYSDMTGNGLQLVVNPPG